MGYVAYVVTFSITIVPPSFKSGSTRFDFLVFSHANLTVKSRTMLFVFDFFSPSQQTNYGEGFFRKIYCNLEKWCSKYIGRDMCCVQG